MSLPIFTKPAARRDIVEIAEFISRDNLSAAQRFLDAVESALNRLADFPELGPRWEHATRYPGLRYWLVDGFPNYVIFYRPIHGEIEVVRVLHGARDLPSVLS